MKRFLIVPALALGLLVSSCATVPGVDPITGGQITTEVTNVQEAATQICGFLPTASTVTNILASFITGASPIATVVNQVAASICSAVTAKSLRRGAGPPRVRGVAIHGTFVRR